MQMSRIERVHTYLRLCGVSFGKGFFGMKAFK